MNKKLLCVICFYAVIISYLSCISVNGKTENYDSIIITNEISELVNEKIGPGDYKYEYIYDFYGNKRYILVSGMSSYLVYDTKIKDYIEYSKDNCSIYSKCENKYLIYFAPTYCFYKCDGNIYEISSNKKLSLNEVDYYKQCIRYNDENIVKNMACERYNQISNRNSVYLADRYYFDNLRYNTGSNFQNGLYPNSCSYVSLEMMLSYYDSIENDNVIAEEYDVNVSRSYNSYDDFDCSLYTESPGINDTFHGYLINYGSNMGLNLLNLNAILVSSMYLLLNEYLGERGIMFTSHTCSLLESKVDFCKNAIDTNNPVIINIVGQDNAYSSQIIDHDVIGYGYDTDGIYVNFGWKNAYHTNANINNYLISEAMYIELDSPHYCSNNYLWSFNGCTGSICACGDIKCNHENSTYYQYNSINHQRICGVCDFIGYENHTFSNFNWLNYAQHKAMCICGYNQTQGHAEEAAYSSGQQYAPCILCGGLARIGIVGPINGNGNSVIGLSSNGSYLLSSGLVVLVDEDINFYKNNSLSFATNE